MKKILAITLALSMVLAFTSCGGDDTATSSAASTAATSSAATTPSTTPSTPEVSTPTVSVAPVEPARENLATTGTAFDDGSDEYYNEASGLDAVADGNTATGWQYKSEMPGSTEENPITEETEGAYQSLSDSNWYLPMTFEEPIFVGVIWEEAVTVNEVQVYFEWGSRPLRSTEGYVIEVSEDGEKWEEVEDAEYVYIEEETPNVAEADVITFEAMEIKGLRIKILNGATKYSPKVWEIEIYAPEADAEADTDGEADAETDAE